ncbi:SET domain-containing protein, partial [Aureobasidium melanogenum]
MEPLTPPPPYTSQPSASTVSPTAPTVQVTSPMEPSIVTPAQKLEMVQAELEVAKLRLRQQARERQGLRRVASSRASVLQRLAPKVIVQSPRPQLGQMPGQTPELSIPKLDQRRIAWNMILSEAHTPSACSMASLSKIMLRDLSMETHHYGMMLVLRAVSVSAMHSSMQNCIAVEDENGDYELLTIHDFAVTNHLSREIQIGSFFVVKEPFFRTVLDEACVLCIDHPSDILFLDVDDLMLPHAWRTDVVKNSPTQWKQAGNEALRCDDPIEAERCYSRALAAMTASQAKDVVGGIVHRNRAQARLCLERWDGAYNDAIAGMRPLSAEQDKFADFQNMKAFYRAGRAAYELGAYDRAHSAYSSVTRIAPDDVDGLRELKRTEARIAEQVTGINFWAATGPQAHGTKMDHADFLRRTEAHQTPTHGRGLFAVEAIACGDIILCEKALAFVPSPAVPESFHLVIPPAATRGTFGTQSNMWTAVIQKILANPSIGPRLLSLYAGPNYSPLDNLNIPMLDGRPVVDIFRVENIIEYNSFGYAHDANLTSFGNAALATPGMDNKDGSMGLWLHSSAINHSCLYNAEHSFIGDMIIFRATRDIAKDEEITTLYKEVNACYETRDAALRTWGFSCDCKLCEADRTCPTLPRRKHLLQQAKEVLERLPVLNATLEPRSVVMMFEDLLAQIEDTYPEEFYRGLPRPGLITLNRYCAFAYSRSDPDKSLQHALAVIDAHGYKLTITGEDLEFDRTNAMSAPQVVDQLMNASRIYEGKGQIGLVSGLRELALEMYIVINGEPSGFETRYGKAREHRSAGV